MAGRVSKASPGQPFRPLAREWNAFADAANYLRDIGGPNLTGEQGAPRFSAGVVWVANVGSTTLRQYGAVGIGNPAGVAPSGTSWQPYAAGGMVFSAAPVSESAPWGILQSPCGPGQLARVVISGPTPCYFASGFSGSFAGPQSGEDTLSDGASPVLWQGEGEAETLGFVSIGTVGGNSATGGELFFSSITGLSEPDANGTSVAAGNVFVGPIGGSAINQAGKPILVTGINSSTFDLFSWYQSGRLATALVNSAQWQASGEIATGPAFCVLNTLHVLG